MDITLAIVGSRSFNDYERLKKIIDYIRTKFNVVKIVSGGARGADSLGAEYATKHNIELVVFPAEWDRLGKSAGYVRNEKIVDNSDFIVAFWDGVSKGTKHTINIAERKNKRLLIKEF